MSSTAPLAQADTNPELLPLLRFSVREGDAEWEVEADSWLVALDEVLRQTGLFDSLRRLAVDVRPNGRVVALDVRGGRRFVLTRR